MNPCKGCEERFPACHDVCEKYQAWKQERAKTKEKIRRFNELEGVVIKHKGDLWVRMWKGHRR